MKFRSTLLALAAILALGAVTPRADDGLRIAAPYIAKILGGTIDGATIGQTSRALGAFSSISTGFSGTPPTDAYFYKSTTGTVAVRYQNSINAADTSFDGATLYFTNYGTGDLTFGGAGSSASAVFSLGGTERMRVNGTRATVAVPLALNAPSVTASAGELAFGKMTASGTAPGAGSGKLALVPGTNANTCKLIVYAGTSTTPSTLLDNIGGGC